MTNLNIMSVNCRGLSGQQKRRDVLFYLRKSQYDVIFLQDTHVTVNSMHSFDRLWPGTCYHACKTSNSRGTSILIRRTLQHDIISEHYDSEGNYIVLICKIHSQIYTFVSVYGPNDDRPVFFLKRLISFCNSFLTITS